MTKTNDQVADNNYPIPPEDMLRTVGYAGVQDFKKVGSDIVHGFLDIGLQPDHSVLDLGCGVGAVAIPLTEYLSEKGSYKGLDIVAEMIDWCRDHITTNHPNFRFQLADVHNKFYNPRGRHEPSEYELPYRDECFDLVWLGSVFTHVLPPALEHYLSEIVRVLRTGGKCWSSYFILNAGSLVQKEGKAADWLAFDYEGEGYRTMTADVPELAVAYELEYLLNVYKKCGLSITTILFGGQDLILAAKQ